MKYIIPIHSREDSYLDDFIRENFSTSLMNNSKWVRFIAALVANWFEIKQCLVKPIWDEEAPTRQLSIDEYTTYGFDYYDSAMESMISGKPRGWYAYKEIEWLDFPLLIQTKEGAAPIRQNLEIIKTIIENIGQFSLELTPNNLRLYAHFRAVP